MVTRVRAPRLPVHFASALIEPQGASPQCDYGQIGILPYAGVDIATFELLKEHMLDVYDGSPPPYCILGAGMLSSTVAQFVSYPLALTRTRLQARLSAML